jgi:hypothetical protein
MKNEALVFIVVQGGTIITIINNIINITQKYDV